MDKLVRRSSRCLACILLASVLGCQTVIERLRGQDGGAADTTSTPSSAGSSTLPGSTPSDAPPSNALGTRGPIPPPKATASTKAGSAPSDGLVPGLSPAALERSFAELDINKDHQLDGIELGRCGCSTADANGDREVTKAEYLAWGLVPHRVTPSSPTSPPAPAPPPPPPPTPTPTPTTPDADHKRTGAQGLPLGEYHCYGLVGTSFGHRGQFRLHSQSTYEVQGDGVQRYSYDPGTKKITWLSGIYSDRTKFRDARYITGKEERITMQTGKDGFYTWDCTTGGR